jgi:hypothetical protein
MYGHIYNMATAVADGAKENKWPGGSHADS